MIKYCGYIIDRHGIHKDKKKMEARNDANA